MWTLGFSCDDRVLKTVSYFTSLVSLAHIMIPSSQKCQSWVTAEPTISSLHSSEGSSTSHSTFRTVGFQWWQLQSTWGQIWGPSWLQGCLQSLTTRDSEFPGILQFHGSGESLALGESILGWSILPEKESLRGHKFVAWHIRGGHIIRGGAQPFSDSPACNMGVTIPAGTLL